MWVLEACREQFDFVLPSMQIDRRRRNFVSSVGLLTTDLVKFFSLCDALLIAVYRATILKFLKMWL